MTERDLLFAVLAFESDLIDLAQLTAACRAWVADKSKPIADLLVERGWITAEDRGFVEKQLERKLAKHQHDPRVTLNSVVRGDVCDAIKQVEDADIQQSLSSWPSSGPVLIETIGETLGEPEQPKSRYTWVSEVGKGGLGKVWLARDNDLAREVALKEVKPGSASTEAVRRLIKEAQITGQLQHPNIVPVYEVNRGGRPFYTMKLVKGETLSKAIRRHHQHQASGGRQPTGQTTETPTNRPTPDVRRDNPPTMFDLLSVFVNVCEALAYAHSRGIIHRDLKPENIVLGDYGEAIVLDWGLAKQIGSADEETAPVLLTEDAQSQATRQGATPGTPAYMSPEQAAGRVDLIDRRTDIYGLGTILFEILTGEAPHQTERVGRSKFKIGGPEPIADSQTSSPPILNFERPTPRFSIHDLLHHISEAPTPRARDVDPTISKELDAVCATAMSKKRDERYLDAKALAADVKRSLAHQPVSVYRTGAWERLRLWRRRNPVVASLSLFLAVTLLTGSVVSTLFGLAANREANRANTESNNAIREQKKAVALSNANAALAQQEKSARENADLNAERERKERQRADEETRRGQCLLYAAKMNLVQTNWENNHFGRMRELLTETQPQPGQPDLRSFEWYYWNRLAYSYLMSLEGHTRSINSVAISADGKWLASASSDNTVKVWDATSGQVTFTLKGPQSWDISSVAISADGKWLASGGSGGSSSGEPGELKVWDATSGQETLTLKGHIWAVRCVAFSANGKLLASASEDGAVKIWDITSGQEILTLKASPSVIMSVAFSPDGKRLAAAGWDETVKVWDATSGQETLTLQGDTGRVFGVAFSADGNRLASASYQTVTVWDAPSAQQMLVLRGHTGHVTSVAFSADGKRLASGSDDQTVRVWNATSGQETSTLKGHDYAITCVAFSPDGKRLASASHDRTVKVWDTASDHETLTLKGHTDQVHSVAFNVDGKRLASAGTDQTVKLWDSTSGQEILTLKGHRYGVGSVTFSQDGKWLASASADGAIKLWDAVSGQETLKLKGHIGGTMSVAFSTDGKRLASASYAENTVKIWDTSTGQEAVALKAYAGLPWSVAFSTDGKRLASAGWGDHAATVWDTTTGLVIHTLKGHTGPLRSVTFCADGNRLASASNDGTVKVWDATSGQQMLTLKGHTGDVMSVAFSADGKRLASAGSDKVVKVWDVTSGQETLTLKGHFEVVASIAFSPDGRRLASASWDNTVKVWDSRPWTPELRAEREALSLIHSLRAQGQSPIECLAAIAADQTLTEPVRQRALQFAREWK